ERSLVAGDRTRADAQRTQSTWSTLNALTLHLGNLAAGRTSVLFVSEMAEPVIRRRGVEGLPTSSSITRAANRANVSIYVFDPRTKAEVEAAADEGPNLLQVLADDSDGAMINGPAEAPEGLKRMLADAASYYLLSYRSSHGRDGLFHTVDVSVKRKGVIVRARHGFWSPTPEEIDRAKLLTGGAVKLPPIKLEPPHHASTLIRPWFGIARGDNGRIRMTFVWEAAGVVPGDRRVKTAATMDVKAVANGVTLFEGSVRDHASVVFDVPPGRVTLTSAVQDSALQTIDHDIRDVLVRDLKGPVVLGTPEVFRARTAKDLRELREETAPVPVASRDFSRAESLVIRVPAYGGAQPPAVGATLVSPAGQQMRQLTIEQPTASAPNARIDLPLAGLPPGQYRVDIAARGTTGSAKDSLMFRVAD
ncbi:MAG TPA: hypothetical protein VN628_07605, partial [Vicinamibacterales bacterium]|nr:hypothetical protein [Vicinamibacterales bacterium]